MWGHYGDNHKGVCLKFKVTEDEKKNPTIQLYTGPENVPMKTAPSQKRDWRTFPFHKVNYAGTYPEIDFFRSLGQLPVPCLEANWYVDENKRSVCADDVFKNEAVWRDRYWKSFHHNISTKLKDWSYEEEYRIILMSHLVDLRPPSNRAFRYDFSDLEGIIFGIKTLDKDKVEIVNAIKNKCAATGRKDFKFFQAYYMRSLGNISAAELSIKI